MNKVRWLVQMLLLVSLVFQCLPASNYAVLAQEASFTTWLPVAKPKLEGAYEIPDPNEPFDNERRFTGTAELQVAQWFFEKSETLPEDVYRSNLYWLTRGEINQDGENFRENNIADDPCDRNADGTAPDKLTSGLFWFEQQSTNFDEGNIEVLSSPAMYVFLYYKEYAQSLIDPNTDISKIKLSFGYGQHSSHSKIQEGQLGVCFPLFMSLLEDSLLQPLHEKLVEKIKSLGLDPADALSADLRSQIADQMITAIATHNLALSPIADWILSQLSEGNASFLAQRFGWIDEGLDQVDAVMRSVVDWTLDNIEGGVDDLSADLFIQQNLFVRHKTDLPTLNGQIVEYIGDNTISWITFAHRSSDSIIIYRIKKHQNTGDYIHEYVVEPLTSNSFVDHSVECGYSYDYWVSTSNGQYFGKPDYTLPAHSRWLRIKEGYKVDCENSQVVQNIYANPTESGSIIYGAFKLYNPDTGKLVKELRCTPGGNMDVMFLSSSQGLSRWLEYSFPKNGFTKSTSGYWILDRLKACRFSHGGHAVTRGSFIGTSDVWQEMYDRVNRLYLFGQDADPDNGAVIGVYTQITDYMLMPDLAVQKIRTYARPPMAPQIRKFEKFASSDTPTEEYDLSSTAFVVGPYITIRKDGQDITPKTGDHVNIVLWIKPGAGKGYKAALWNPRNYYLIVENVDLSSVHNGSTYPRSETDGINDLLVRQSEFNMEVHMYVFDEKGITLTVLKKPIWPYQPFPPQDNAVPIKPNRFILPSQTILVGSDLRLFDQNDAQVYPIVMASNLNKVSAIAIEGTANIGWTYTATGDIVTAIYSAEALANYNIYEVAKISGSVITVVQPSRSQLFLPIVRR